VLARSWSAERSAIAFIIGVVSRALMTADAGIRLQRSRKWVTVQQGTDHVRTDWLYI